MRFDILTLFPEQIDAVLGESIIGRAQKSGVISVFTHNIRDYTENKHKKVDDAPYGGGRGMLMATQPICDCFDAVSKMQGEGKSRVIYMSPRGRIFNHSIAKELSEYDNLTILCGHYEGIDQRVIDEIVDEEISIGDYVLTGGELPACILVDAVSRLIDGVLSDESCYEDESIASGLLEYPQYTRPAVFRGKEVPEVLLSGHHANIEAWRLERSIELTRERRPDLYDAYIKIHPPKSKVK
ncbi:MAG: tRNA (guanosine(37)-N1)-methyltransferase TrmD [Clostridia bacterium]|nr:tRNA (guanosine(37)-N1)-methyltransferase TrmD [Clostridia bacterium]